jgi:hypothetical protein
MGSQGFFELWTFPDCDGQAFCWCTTIFSGNNESILVNFHVGDVGDAIVIRENVDGTAFFAIAGSFG